MELNSDKTRKPDIVIQRIIDLLSARQKSQSELCSFLCTRRDTFTRWKYEAEGRPYLLYIDKIADFLDVSVDYLLFRTEYANPMEFVTSRETGLLQQFRELDNEKQGWILQAIKSLDENSQNSNNTK